MYVNLFYYENLINEFSDYFNSLQKNDSTNSIVKLWNRFCLTFEFLNKKKYNSDLDLEYKVKFKFMRLYYELWDATPVFKDREDKILKEFEENCFW